MLSRLICCVVTRSSLMITKSVTAVSRQSVGNLSNQLSATCIPSSTFLQRNYSQTTAMTVDYDYVKKATNDRNILLIDVREPDELKEHGVIPNSINIPLGNVETALGQLSDNQFAETYKRPKPVENTEIIFFCMIGKRSGKAQESAQKLGYKNVKNYLGSFNDWKVKNKA